MSALPRLIDALGEAIEAAQEATLRPPAGVDVDEIGSIGWALLEARRRAEAQLEQAAAADPVEVPGD